MPADAWGFVNIEQEHWPKRQVGSRIHDWQAVLQYPDEKATRTQAARCMDCGIPFCHQGCPLANQIPEFNLAVGSQEWERGLDVLHATNNFPELTGWLCPAPCQASCVLSITDGFSDAFGHVEIKMVEATLAGWGFEHDMIQPVHAITATGKKVAVIGSGPAGLACAQQLGRGGHSVHVFERDAMAGGLLRYGIPEFKFEKALLEKRLKQLEGEGIVFHCNTDISREDITEMGDEYDAVVVAIGAQVARPLQIPIAGAIGTSASLRGVHDALAFLHDGSNTGPGDPLSAYGKRVVVIGGGDTAADCLGTALRQGAADVIVVDHNIEPPTERDNEQDPWPLYPRITGDNSSHAEGGALIWSNEAVMLHGDEHNHVRGVSICSVVTGSGAARFTRIQGATKFRDCELVLNATGFVGAHGWSGSEAPACVSVDETWQTLPGVFACGDSVRGASLIVWAIAEGRSCAAAVDKYLIGRTSLPAPVRPYEQSWYRPT